MLARYCDEPAVANGPLVDGQVTLINGDECVWPIAKVFKRITNGSEDNVAVYFKVLVEDYWTASKT